MATKKTKNSTAVPYRGDGSVCKINTPTSRAGKVALLRGAIVNRTYGTHKNLSISLFLQTVYGPVYSRSPVIMSIKKKQSQSY